MFIKCPHCHNSIDLPEGPATSVVCSSCGSSIQLEGGSTEAWQEGPRRIGKFEILDQLGVGSFGTVYKARDTELDRTVAIKIPRSGSIGKPEDQDRFLREARSAAQLNHPSIVSLYDVGRTDDTCYLVSELVQGATLAERLSAGRLSFRQAAELIAQVADALHYAHSHGVIHRDIKPSNIMLDLEDRPHLMDFGLAKRSADEITLTLDGQILGTPAYMSPEQARGEMSKVDARSDIYSLGVILYELLTGELPFRGQMRMLIVQVIRDEPRPPRRLNDRIPKDLETICLKAMSKEPGRRYASAGALADDLRRYLKGEPILARPLGKVARGWRWCRRNPAVAGLAAALVLVVVVGFAGVLWKWQEAEAARADADQAKLLAQDDARRLNEANGLMEKARLHADRNQWAEALADLTRATKAFPQHSYVWRERGNLYFRLGLWDLAGQDYAQAQERQEALTTLPWYNLALLSLVAGDTKTYRQICPRMLDRFGAATDGVTAAETARTCSLAPMGAADTQRIVKLAELASTSGIIFEKPLMKTRYTSSKAKGNWPYGWIDHTAGLAYYRAGQFEKSVLILHKASFDYSWGNRAICYPVLALAYHHERQPSKAREYLGLGEKALDNAIEDLLRQQPLGTLPSGWQDWLECQLLCREAKLAIDGIQTADDARLRLLRGRSLAALGRGDAAATEFDKALAFAKEKEVPLECFRFYADRGDEEKADRAFDKACALAPDKGQMWFQRGRFFQGQQAWTKAEAAFAQAAKLQLNSPDFWSRRGEVQVRLENWDAAAAHYKKALAMMPNDRVLRQALARLHVKLQRWDEVADDYTALLKNVSNHSSFISEQSRLCLELAQWDPAMDKVLARRPMDLGLLLARGRTRARQERWPEVAADYEKFIGSLPPNDDAWLEYACVLLLAGKGDAGNYLRFCKEKIDRYGLERFAVQKHVLVRLCVLAPQPHLEPGRLLEWARAMGTDKFTQPWHAHALGAALFRAGEFDEAIHFLNMSWNLDRGWPGQTMNAVFLAMAYQQLKKTEEAREWFKKTDAWLANADLALKKEGTFPSQIYPADWLIVRVLRQEARTAMEGRK